MCGRELTSSILELKYMYTKETALAAAKVLVPDGYVIVKVGE